MNPRSRLALLAGKATAAALRLAGSGGGALPGLVSQRLDPSLLTRLGGQFAGRTILVCGTNGKTTTSRMVAAILEAAGQKLVYNRSGSNMVRGHLAAFLSRSDWLGSVRADQVLLEVDEAVLPATLRQIRPRAVVLHNLFRDQLDRYGEVDAIARSWLEAIRTHLPAECLLLVNADDPNLAYLAEQSGHPLVRFYGIDDPAVATETPTSTVDAYLSPRSGQPLTYRHYYLSHLGDYADPGGQFRRPTLDYAARYIQLDTVRQQASFQLGEIHYSLPLPGLYNVYNALAAASLGSQLSIPTQTIQASLASLPGAFGRFQRLQVGERELVFCLIKNPAGASEVLRTIAADQPLNLAVFANDRFADGLDVSWYWDTEVEPAASSLRWLLCSGSRAQDMALRFKYAEASVPAILVADPAKALDRLLQESPSGRTYVLSTYTATLDLQRLLHRRGLIPSHWKE